MTGEMSDSQWLGGYHLVRVIGSGGTGTVWEAEDAAGIRVALKLLHPSLANTDSARARLLREARLVNQVRSARVARVLDVEAEASSPFVVTELVTGVTLEHEIDRFPYTPEDAAQLGAELAEVITSIHEAGIAHRDLKPSNVILTSDGPVLIDFGIAHGEGDSHLTQTGLVTGTAGYVAPELLVREASSLRGLQAGDWFAWSALLLKAMTGRPPFGSGRTDLTIKRVFDGDPDVEGLDEEFAELFTQALASDPQNRLDPEVIVAVLTGESEIQSPAETVLEEPPAWISASDETWVPPKPQYPSQRPIEAASATAPLLPWGEAAAMDQTVLQAPPHPPAQPGWGSYQQPHPLEDQLAGAGSDLRPYSNPAESGYFPSQAQIDGVDGPEPTNPGPSEPRPLSGVGALLLLGGFLALLAWIPVYFHLAGVLGALGLLGLGQLGGAAVRTAWLRKAHKARGATGRAFTEAVGAPVRAIGAALALLPGLAAGGLAFYASLMLAGWFDGQTLDLLGPAHWLSGRETPWDISSLAAWLASLAGLCALWSMPPSRPMRLGLSRFVELTVKAPLARFLLGVLLVVAALALTAISMTL